MSIDKIDKAIYDKERYDSLRERGVSEDRAKRVATVPKNRKPKRTTSSRKRSVIQKEFDDVRQPDRDLHQAESDSPQITTTSPRTGI